jgi:glycosyltransferase involved in cell wall biosynthesis
MSKPQLISFILPAWTEASTLPATLQALRAAARELPESSEVIVVDDDSIDGTAAIGREYGARVVSVQHRQIAATRNAGAREARGDLLFFIDADTLVDVEVLRAAITAVRQGAIGGGSAFRFDGWVPFYGRVLQRFAVHVYRVARLASGCFLFCTREAFEATGGFNTQLYAGEEGAMSRALRRQGRFVVLRHYVTTSGRKLRTHSIREVFHPLIQIVRSRGRSLRQRADIWYGERKKDEGRRVKDEPST